MSSKRYKGPQVDIFISLDMRRRLQTYHQNEKHPVLILSNEAENGIFFQRIASGKQKPAQTFCSSFTQMEPFG